jgi:hypothetical protein
MVAIVDKKLRIVSFVTNSSAKKNKKRDYAPLPASYICRYIVISY